MERVWQVLDGQVASGRIPGYAAAIRIRGEAHVRAGGRASLGADAAPAGEDTLFRIASITKPIAGALTLSLVQDGLLALDDPIARWLPEAADPASSSHRTPRSTAQCRRCGRSPSATC
ncbi:beta-lactamase family protein [Pseudonocardia sp. DSM 110487]|uniref:serine hydrolase domain-containing protein n=1 Tax=Pseudonocardia sp. DSM 110487 TaxID=2865833 RepID=UPI001C69D5F7|nr:serine hydrolase domain-containing protein [Pseudonocardia sp. DSM 110487]QYN36665.1 beta-lactamase family protein [Pseudonocardia sp. DSM 110487]